MDTNIAKIETYVLELTNKCNERCNFCYSISYDSNLKTPRLPDQLDKRTWINGLEQISKNGGNAVDFSGGEPTLHPSFPEILLEAKKLGLETIVSTNGSTYHNEQTKNSLIGYADCIALSIHGVGELHDKIKNREGSYQTVLDSYQNYIKLGKKIKINTVACQENIDYLREIGEVLDINNSKAQWKVIQSIPRESGKINQEKIEISNDSFDKVQESLKQFFPKTYSEKRLTFREDDSEIKKYQFVPYIIVASNGQVHIPVGKQHLNLGISINDIGYYSKLEQIFNSLGNFPHAVNENHQKFYNFLKNDSCEQCTYQPSLGAMLHNKGII